MINEKSFAWMSAAVMLLIVGALMAGIYTFEAGLTMALFTWCGLMIMYFSAPPWLKWGIVKMRWLVDLTITFGTPVIMGRTVTGILAGILLGILTTFTLRFEHMRINKKFSFQQKQAEKRLAKS